MFKTQPDLFSEGAEQAQDAGHRSDPAPRSNEAGALDDRSSEDPRVVNRRLRAERRQDKQRQMQSRRNVGALLPLLREACSGKRKADAHGQLAFLLGKAELFADTGRDRKVSEHTRSTFGNVLSECIDALRRLRAPVMNIGELGRAHAVVLTRHWVEQGLAPATIQKKCSVLRKFLTLIGKPSAMPRRDEWTALLQEKGISAKALRRSRVAELPRSWVASGIDALAKIREIAEQQPIVASELELQLAFGLRVKESMQIHPVLADAGTRLHVTEGSKGGRPRWVDFDPDPDFSAWQREVLDRATLRAEQHRKKCLSVPDRTLEQMRNHYYYVMRRHGITRKELGVVSHGLRHQFAHRRQLAVSGMPAPVLRQVPYHMYQENRGAVAAATDDTAMQLGHFRRDVTAWYNGTPAHFARQASNQLAKVRQLFEDAPAVATALATAGVLEAWLIGRVVYGMALSPDEPIVIAVLFAGDAAVTAAALQIEVEGLVGRPVLLMSAAAGCPPDAVKLTFRPADPASKSGGCDGRGAHGDYSVVEQQDG